MKRTETASRPLPPRNWSVSHEYDVITCTFVCFDLDDGATQRLEAAEQQRLSVAKHLFLSIRKFDKEEEAVHRTLAGSDVRVM